MRKKFAMLALAALVGSAAVSTAWAASKISEGSQVKLKYSFEADGVPVVSKNNPETMILTVGESAYPPDFERQLIGMKVGERKTISLRPEQAYGPYRQELVKRVAKAQLPPELNLREGMMLRSGGGQPAMRVVKMLDDSVILDQNHPLSGKSLAYQVQITEVA